MKIIEAMKRVKMNKEKIADLQGKIATFCANMSYETALYGDRTKAQVEEWIQSCEDTAKENIKLLTAIQRTNMAIFVTIDFGPVKVTRTIAEWIWRRREYAAVDAATWGKLTDRNLREGNVMNSTGQQVETKIVRHYDPIRRDEKLAMYRSEAKTIDAQLEVVNAITDLME